MREEIEHLEHGLRKPNISLTSLISLAESAYAAISRMPTPRNLPDWAFESRGVTPSLVIAPSHKGPRIVVDLPSPITLRRTRCLVRAEFRPTLSGVVTTFEFRGIPSLRQIDNDDTHRWTRGTGRDVALSLERYFTEHEATIHEAWLDAMVRSELENIRHICSLPDRLGQVATTLIAVLSPYSDQVRYRDILGEISVPPMRGACTK
jgi:hypothetical protein